MIVIFIKRNINLQIKKEVNLIAAGIVIGEVGLSVGSGLSISRSAPVGIVCAGSFSFLSSISASIANEYFLKLKIQYTKLRDWIVVNTLV